MDKSTEYGIWYGPSSSSMRMNNKCVNLQDEHKTKAVWSMKHQWTVDSDQCGAGSVQHYFFFFFFKQHQQ